MTVLLIGALAACVLTQSEEWPLSSFRLFSGLRSGRSSDLKLVAVAADGSEHTIDVGKNRSAARSALHEVPELPELSPPDQRGVVRAWLRIAELDPSKFRAVRLYRRTVRQPTREREPPEVLTSHLVVEVPL